MNDFITTLLGVKESEVEYCKETVKNRKHTFYIRLVNRGQRCPECGYYTREIKEYRNKHITHSVLLNETSEILYNARRFLCPKCGKTFYEDNPFTEQYSRISDKTVENVLALLKNYNETFSSVAKKVNLSAQKVMNIFDERVQIGRKELSESIGIDEFYFSRHASKKYALMVLSLNKGYVIDLLPSRDKHRLHSYFHRIPKEEREKVKFISIDMNENYRDVLYSCFPNAKICADPFHVVRRVFDSLDRIRLSLLRKFENDKRSDQYYLLKYQKHLLFEEIQYQNYSDVKKNHHFKYHLTDLQKRNMLLSISGDLERSYYLCQRYKSFDRSLGSPIEKAEELDLIINKMFDSQITELVSLAATLLNWHIEIINSFFTISKRVSDHNGNSFRKTVRVTSGPVEGRNKYIKIIIRLANGFSNFDRFRNRALYVLNKNDSPSDMRIENSVTRHFPKKQKM